MHQVHKFVSVDKIGIMLSTSFIFIFSCNKKEQEKEGAKNLKFYYNDGEIGDNRQTRKLFINIHVHIA